MMSVAGRLRWGRAGLCVALAALASSAAGCAYYNTFYSARKNFQAAEKLYRNPDERATPQQIQFYDKSLQSATKVVVQHAKSKWVDDAVMLMGRSFLGKGDYDKARQKFEELAANFPKSELRDQALFYYAETYRREKKWELATTYLDSLRRTYPKSHLLQEAALRQGQIALGERRARDAVAVLEPLTRVEIEERLGFLAHRTLADAYFRLEAYDSARVHYAWAAEHTKADDLVQEMRFKQAEMLEARRDFDGAIQVYLRREKQARTPEFRDAARIRRAYAMARGGHTDDGIRVLQQMVEERGRTPVAGEALFKIGYIQEVLLDDLEAARKTYASVSELGRGTQSAQQAESRSKNLEKIQALRAAASADTTGREQAAGAAFSLAEHYLFEGEQPYRAIQEYAHVESTFAGTDFAPKAAFAVAWVLDRKLERPQSADSAWRRLVDQYPETLYGRAASAYLRGRADSLRAAGALEPTLVTYPLLPGVPPYVPPDVKQVLQKSKPPSAATAPPGLAPSPKPSVTPPPVAGSRSDQPVPPAPPSDTSHVIRP